MAALVQTLPQQTTTATVTMLQTRPSSASGILQPSHNQPSHHQYSSSPQQRNGVHGMNNMAGSNYRGHNSIAPITPYAFNNTPGLSMGGQQNGSQFRPEQQRTASAPIVPTLHQGGSGNPPNRSRYPAPLSVSTTSSSSSSDLSSLGHKSGSRDDSTISSTARLATRVPRPHSTVITFSGSNTPSGMSSPGKPAPDRYRRPAVRHNSSSTNTHQNTQSVSSPSTMPNVMQFYGASTQQSQSINTQAFNLQMPQSQNQPRATADDMQLNRNSTSEQAKRYRRRSIHTIDAHELHNSSPTDFLQQGSRQVSNASVRADRQPEQHPLRSSPVVTVRPATSHGRDGSTDSLNSTPSNHSRPNSSNKREATSVSMASGNPAQSLSSSSPVANTNTLASADQANSKNDVPRLVNIPQRGSSTDAAKRVANSSPLSKPVTMGSEPTKSKDSFASTVNAALQPTQTKATYAQVANGQNATSPAAQHLAALNEKDGKKSKTSRLRRAFSFGSAAELRKASAENNLASRGGPDALDRSKLRKEKYQLEREAEQDKIAQQQEAAGIGSNIYSGQGNFFTGSTDNLSISSTASSASIMIRKMGKGMKKSTRSLVGLFRPKSVIGVPAADAAVPEASQAQVSMVTVEAEREKVKVNVNANPHDLTAGGTGYPRLERNSLDAAAISSAVTERLGSASTENSSNRRSIVGGERERAEVLAAVKKGILKRSGTGSGNSSPVILPADGKAANFTLPQIPTVNDTPNSSAPSTPGDDQAHKRTGSVTLGGEDYFMSALRFRGDSKSVPGTPQGSAKRNATFSPRIQFHDTWPSQEYDRRGEIATCNRLTPMLAQQIKEELNTFKMAFERSTA
ncbi:Immunoglobulin A1 protease protein [Rutstroemia sp. NJR-2017a BBW]|nr:Immunoglobulin A1 protease protein [Rutstroemia sp. NJR-2017a BBW]